MPHCYHTLATWWRAALLLAGLLTITEARAQAPAWGGAAWGSFDVEAITTDAAGSVFVAGYFSNTLTLGSTTLTSAGGGDLLVAKWVPATGTWAWAVRGGGLGNDMATSIAVSGNSVYVTGSFLNTLGNAWGATLAGSDGANPVQVNGASNTFEGDLLLAKWTDNGSSATLNWSQVAGGTWGDAANGVAVSGSSVYVTGFFQNDAANGNQVAFGGNGTTPGTVAVSGVSPNKAANLFMAKYFDQGSSVLLGWVQVGGGLSGASGYGVAAQGSSVYVTGHFFNDTGNSRQVLVSGTPVRGATATVSGDLLLVKYQDDGGSGRHVWSQVAGGTGNDYGLKVAVGSAGSVYVVGNMSNNRSNATAFVLGGNGSTAGTAPQYGASSAGPTQYGVLLAKYTDNGPAATFNWSQVAGGNVGEWTTGLAVSGTSVFVTGSFANDPNNAAQVVLGGSGAAAGTTSLPGLAYSNGPFINQDGMLARYTDNGATGRFDWVKPMGGFGWDRALGVAVSGQQVYVAGVGESTLAFGAATVPASHGFVAYLADPALPLPTRAGAAAAGLALWPNPAAGGRAHLSGAAPGQAVRVLDALGRVVATATADATGTAQLGGLAPGLYLVRAGTGSGRLAVE